MPTSPPYVPVSFQSAFWRPNLPFCLHCLSCQISRSFPILHPYLFQYSVFALGSTAYPHFAAFGRYLDQTMRELGAEAIYAVGEGDELCGQEQSFRKWAEEVFKAACDTFCLGDDVNMSEATGALNSNDLTWKPNKFRIAKVENGKEPDICEGY
ncbi:nitric oxide synthase [Plakobranchus ocellatus]|uniref:nitric-oxide synthase (NADPH) n=1 Tax=Plakobranchus ocellatus TaxID=259542 RepID=A0AAV4AWJ3_9GAST|nr:nitric oxide synthase [Plakobranchus ocellatus]